MRNESRVVSPESRVDVPPCPPGGVGGDRRLGTRDPGLWTLSCLLLLSLATAQDKPKSYRLPSTDLKQQVIWGASLEIPDGPSLAFGGEDQKAADGNPHTRIKVDGAWKAIHEELRGKNPQQALASALRGEAENWKRHATHRRAEFFEGAAAGENDPTRKASGLYRGMLGALDDLIKTAKDGLAKELLMLARASAVDIPVEFTPQAIRALSAIQVVLEQAADACDAEPPPRALSPIAYDEKSKLFVVFGGDHLDYLTNDTWVFDPAKKTWTLRQPKTAPPPRANHKLTAADGKIVLTGGYTCTSSTDYVGGQYRDLNDGEWTYDVAANAWTGGKGVEPDGRTYRTGRLHPDYYLEGPKPEATSFEKVPPNTWVKTKPPHLPALNRDWGTAVIDPDRDLILRFSGGHSAHGGTDVLQYHMKTNRWELCFPVEFPLGQLYSNTEYPEGVNFNGRPWVTGHTYQNYGYDPILKRMLFTGRRDGCFVYNPTLGDWTERMEKPKGMTYGDCFYTLTLTPTPQGLVCWNHDGHLYQFEKNAWVERPLTGKLPGSVVDNSTLVYDSKRERLLFWRKPYGDKTGYTGEVTAVDVKTWTVSTLTPAGKEGAAAVSYLCQIRYDSDSDLCLAGCMTSTGRTPAYDPAGDRWVTLKITGEDPHGKNGRNVSLGMQYDPKRKLFWAVDTNSQVYVLRLDLNTADLQPM